MTDFGHIDRDYLSRVAGAAVVPKPLGFGELAAVLSTMASAGVVFNRGMAAANLPKVPDQQSGLVGLNLAEALKRSR